MSFLLGKKIEMVQVFKGKKAVPVTLIEAGPCVVSQVKTKEKDGYSAVQLEFERKKKEFRVEPEHVNSFEKGQQLDVSVFKEGDRVKVSGISKGKGFQGTVKRWGFSGFGASHGVKHGERAPGSIGGSFPERVLRGKKMAGHMGANRVTVKNLEVLKIGKDSNLLALKGAVPGHRGTLLEITEY